MSYTGSSRPAFRLGETLQATFDAATSNFLTFFLLGLLLYSLPLLVVTFVIGAPSFDAAQLPAVAQLARWGATSFVTFATSVILQAALARGVVTHLSGGKATVVECLRPALSVFVPLLAISFLASLGAILGLVLLVAPGVFLLLVWSVVAPVEVVERASVFAAFSRSVELTRGRRWAILLIFIAVWLVALVIQGLFSALVQLLGLSPAGATGIWIGSALVQAVGGAVGVVFTGAAPGAVYYELRRAKEGALPEQLAAVFD